LKYPPGEKFTYNTGIMITLEVLLSRVAGMPAHQFAEKFLFDPLKIFHYKWDNIAGLHLQPRDMAKIGYLFLHKGSFDGKQIIAGDWYDRSSARLQSCDGPKYWNHWGPNVHFVENHGLIGYSAGGFGGQMIFGFPSLDLVVVLTAGNFLGDADHNEMLDKFILPAALTDADQKQFVSSNETVHLGKSDPGD
jgi:CubicO group peptidase (beta-lactamase class C family)